ncbi:unnamed protein product [Cunninghamella blakesleeana]
MIRYPASRIQLTPEDIENFEDLQKQCEKELLKKTKEKNQKQPSSSFLYEPTDSTEPFSPFSIPDMKKLTKNNRENMVVNIKLFVKGITELYKRMCVNIEVFNIKSSKV